MSITLCQLTDQLQPKTGSPFAIFVLSILLILYHPDISNKFYYGTGKYQLNAQNKISTDECCFGEHCVRLWSSYGPKQGIPWHFFVSIYFINDRVQPKTPPFSTCNLI